MQLIEITYLSKNNLKYVNHFKYQIKSFHIHLKINAFLYFQVCVSGRKNIFLYKKTVKILVSLLETVQLEDLLLNF